MASGRSILAIDQGTPARAPSCSNQAGPGAGRAQRELPQIFPRRLVEHDPEEIWRATLAVCRERSPRRPAAGDIAALGISNQREPPCWERATGLPLYNASSGRTAAARRSAPAGRAGPRAGGGAQDRLLIDSYFSAPKMPGSWTTSAVPAAAAERGELAFGTVDSFLLWRLTGGASTPPMPPTPRAPCSTTSRGRNGRGTADGAGDSALGPCPRCATMRRVRHRRGRAAGCALPIAGMAGDSRRH